MKYKRREEGNRETIWFFSIWCSNKAVKRTHTLPPAHTQAYSRIQTDGCAAGDSGKEELQSV